MPQTCSPSHLHYNKSPTEINRRYFHKTTSFQLNKKQDHQNDSLQLPKALLQRVSGCATAPVPTVK